MLPHKHIMAIESDTTCDGLAFPKATQCSFSYLIPDRGVRAASTQQSAPTTRISGTNRGFTGPCRLCSSQLCLRMAEKAPIEMTARPTTTTTITARGSRLYKDASAHVGWRWPSIRNTNPAPAPSIDKTIQNLRITFFIHQNHNILHTTRHAYLSSEMSLARLYPNPSHLGVSWILTLS